MTFQQQLASMSARGRVCVMVASVPGTEHGFLTQFSLDGIVVRVQAWSRTLDRSVEKLYERCVEQGVL